MDNATAYIIEFYKEDPNCEGTPVLSETIEGTEFTKEGLEGETEYTIRVKSIAEGLNDSKWSVISGSPFYSCGLVVDVCILNSFENLLYNFCCAGDDTPFGVV